ncbi:O-antigen ligase family protein [Rhizosaccharibacter radicis]|uniref:O-antigen ligase family protein n=1 Tax=Rhizosaccharibacter radicis TaxID=2782605 RepID=A0ABT1VTC7_9PROT|nr:O-antigen ligase family protein [Acetobacteraceae bacterium KSS12]
MMAPGRAAAAIERLILAAILLCPVFLVHGRGIAEALIDVAATGLLARGLLGNGWEWARQPWVRVSLLWWNWLVLCSLPVLGLGAGGWPAFGQAVLTVRFLLFAAAMGTVLPRAPRVRRAVCWLVVAACGYIVAQMAIQAVFGVNLFGMHRFGDGTLTGPYDKPRAAAPLSRLLMPVMLAAGSMLATRGRPGGSAAAAWWGASPAAPEGHPSGVAQAPALPRARRGGRNALPDGSLGGIAPTPGLGAPTPGEPLLAEGGIAPGEAGPVAHPRGFAGRAGRTLLPLLPLLGGLAVMVLAGQRMPLLLTLLGLVVAALMLPRLRLPVLLAAIAAPVLVALSAVLTPRSFGHLVLLFSRQMHHFGNSPYGHLFERALNMGLANPLTGLGFDGFRHRCADPRYFGRHLFGLGGDGGGAAICAQHPHNHYLQALTDSGLIGLVLFCLMVLFWLRTLARGLGGAGPAFSGLRAWRVGLFAAVLMQEWPIASTSAFTNMPLGGWCFLLLGLGMAFVPPTPGRKEASMGQGGPSGASFPRGPGLRSLPRTGTSARGKPEIVPTDDRP